MKGLRENFLAAAIFAVVACFAPFCAESSDGDAAAIRGLLMHQFDKPEARLVVEPVVVRGSRAIAGWVQAERGGRALLRRDRGKWKLVACAGDAFKEAAELQKAGIARAQARELARALVAAEKNLPADQVRKFSLFDGVVRMDESGAHPQPGHTGHGGKAH